MSALPIVYELNKLVNPYSDISNPESHDKSLEKRVGNQGMELGIVAQEAVIFPKWIPRKIYEQNPKPKREQDVNTAQGLDSRVPFASALRRAPICRRRCRNPIEHAV
jgi:hypothetical protein